MQHYFKLYASMGDQIIRFESEPGINIQGRIQVEVGVRKKHSGPVLVPVQILGYTKLT